MAKAPSLPTITGSYASSTQLNAAFRAIEDAFDNTLSRDGSTPNQMDADLDLNSNDLLNVGLVSAESLTLDGVDVTDLAAQVNADAERAEDAADRVEAVGVKLFDTRSDYTTWIALGNTVTTGRTYWVGGLPYQGQIGATVTGLTGLVPHPKFAVTPDHFAENTVPGTTDMLAALDAALLWVSTRGRVVTLLTQAYYHSATLTFPFVLGVRLVGEDPSRISGDSFVTRLLCDAVSGPQIRRTHSAQDIVGVSVRATGARQSLSYDVTMPGILTEYGTDTSAAGCEGNTLQDVAVFNQPGDGFLWSGYAFMQNNERIAARDCKGRPFHVDDGRITGRTNTERPGAFKFILTRAFGCGGPPKFGNRGTFGTYRFEFQDCDWQPGTQNATLNPDNTAFDFHGESAVCTNMAIEGRVAGVVTLSGMRLSGRGIQIIAPRFVGVTSLIDAVDDATIGCDDIVLSTPFATNDCVCSPAITTTGAVGNVTVWAPIVGTSGQKNITSWFSGGYTKGVLLTNASLSLGSKALRASSAVFDGATTTGLTVTRDGAEAGTLIERTGSGAATHRTRLSGGISITEHNGNATGGTQVTIADDAAVSITPPRQGGFALIMMNGATDPDPARSGFIYFDTGSTTQIIEGTPFAGMSGNFDVTTSDVTGTTGTDGNVRVAARSGVLKIENRSGASATFQVTFL